MVSADVAGSLVYGSQTVLLLLVASGCIWAPAGTATCLPPKASAGSPVPRSPAGSAAPPAAGRRLPPRWSWWRSRSPCWRSRQRRRGDPRRRHRGDGRADRRGGRRHPSAADARRVSARLRVRVRLRRVGGRHRARRSDRARCWCPSPASAGPCTSSPVPSSRSPRAGPSRRAGLSLAYEPGAVGGEQPEPLRDAGGLHPGPSVELGQDAGDVDGDGLLADVEAGGDLAVGGAARHQLQDVELPGGEPDPLRGGRLVAGRMRATVVVRGSVLAASCKRHPRPPRQISDLTPQRLRPELAPRSR